ncbi:hypothetical protein KIM67_04110 [Flagellimonas sp. 389]|uniref:hypothetical protein n=1 Tax=Flagellimonas sp. 389 TaxID=2835862 RepID=UPI001BD6995A|nr:hypothetical protein [Flagellimonas sp. 389]MBS9461582.1 hypothetical protein [Flagellimonas sp. 389]
MKRSTILLLIAILFTYGNLIAQEVTKKPKIQFGKAFKISSTESLTIGNQDEHMAIQLIDVIEEWGYDAPPEDENRNYFSDIEYTLKVVAKDIEKSISFYSSEIENKANLTITFEGYKIGILSDTYNNSSASIEMVVTKNEDK